MFNLFVITANLNTYVISYLRANGSPDTTYADWQWVSTAKNVVGGSLMPVGGIVSRKMGTTFSVTVGSIIYT